MANAVIPQKTLRLGVNESLYVATGGAINTTGAMGAFGLPPQCSNYRGTLVIQSVAVGGTVSSAVFQLEVSIDGGTTWSILNIPFGITAANSTLTKYAGFDIAAASSNAIALNVSGLGGSGTLRLNFTTLTLGTGTGLNIFAHIG